MRVGVDRSQLSKAAFVALLVPSMLIASRDARADEPAAPAGYITIGRDVPAHNAFRKGDPGQPTNVATGREDVIVAATRPNNQAPQSLPDSALDGVGAYSSQPAAQISPASGTMAGIGNGTAMGSVGTSVGRTTSAIGTHVMQALPSGSGARGIAPAGAILSSMPGVK